MFVVNIAVQCDMQIEAKAAKAFLELLNFTNISYATLHKCN
jgi:hypothetical protein